MKRIVFILGLLFSTATMQSTYNVGTIDSISGTNNGGTGYGNATQASAVGYVTAGFTNQMQLNGSAIQPDGKTVVVGADVTAGNAIVARYNINGTEDTTFNSGFFVATKFGVTSAIARAVTVLPNGKIVVVGSVVDTETKFFVAQFLPDGSLDITGFNSGGTPGYVIQNITVSSADVANAVAVDSSGNIYVVGTSTQATYGSVFIAKYNASGSLQTGSYNSSAVVGGTGTAVTIAGIAMLDILTTSLAGNGCVLDANNNIVVTGAAGSALLVTRFLTTGLLDTIANSGSGFNESGTPGYNTQGSAPAIGYAVGLQSTGKIVIAGIDTPNALVLRYTTAGLLDSYANNPGSPFGTGGASSQTGYITSVFEGTAAIARGLAIQSNDTIVIGGNATISSNQSLLTARYLADGSALDTSFSTDGYTATYVASADNGNTLSMQENGSFILAGDYTSGNTNFITARYLGNIPQGCMDYTYNPAVETSPGAPGYRTYPTDTTPTNLPKVTAIYPAASGDLYVVTSGSSTQLVQLDSAGETSSTAVTIAKTTPNDVITDYQNRAVVIGIDSGNGWIARYYDNGGTMTIDSTFNGGAIVTVTDAMSLVRVCEQGSNRLVVIGQSDAEQAIVIGYTENGEIDFSFGNGFGYLTESGGITFNDMIIDANNGIYIAYQFDGGNIWIEKLLSNGSDIDESFATGSLGKADTGLVSASYTTPCLSFDNSGNIVLSVVEISTGDIKIQVYPPTGTGSPASTSTISQTTTLLSTPVITKLQCDMNNRLIFTGYDDNDFFVGRCGSGVYTLDTTFASYSSSPGLLKTMYSTNNPSDGTTPARVSNSVGINTNGAILFGGYENESSTETVSVVGQVVGNTGGTVYTQVNRYPGIDVNDVGTLDTTFGLNGALNLLTATGFLPAGQAKVMNVLATNKILVTSADGVDTVLARLTSGYALDTSFSTDGLVTLTGLVTPTAIMVDTTAANYYVLGENSTPRGVIHKVVASDGSLAGGAFPVTTTLTSAYAIAQQASGRILVAGYDSAYAGGASGVIAAYTPAGALDTSFNPSGATPGYWYTGVASPIMSMSIGTIATQLDRIYLAYSDGGAAALGNAVVQQLLENGTAYAPTSGTGAFTPITAGFTNTVNGNTQLRMQLAVDGKIVVGAATAATYGTTPAIKAARYPATGGTADVGPVSILAGTANQIIENILTLSDSTTLILAAVPNATATSAFMSIAQLNASFALDPTFNPDGTDGYLTTNVPSLAFTPVMEDFYALDVLSTGGILISGDNDNGSTSAANPYLAKIYATATPTKVSQSATSLGAAGTLDTTFNPASTNAGFMNLATELQTTNFPSATTVTSLLQTSTGTYYIGGSTTTNSYVTLMSDDDVQDATFGLITIAGANKTNLSAMLLTQAGNLLVAGAGAGTSGSGWIVSLNPTTGAVVSAFAPTTFLDSNYAIAQQTNGRILVAGVISGVGKIIAYNSVTGAVDTTFASSGIYTPTGYGAINSMIVDASNNIYFIANNGTDAKVVTLNESGTGAAAGWTIPTVTANSTIAANNHLAFNQAGNIVAVAVNTTDDQIVLSSYNTSGSVQTTCTLEFGGTGITIPHATDLLIDLDASPGKAIITGYDSNTSPATPFIIRIADDQISLDESFNGSGVQLGYGSGSITGTSGATWNSAMINADGKITVGGYEVISAVNTPYTMRVYGDDFIGQYSPSLTPLTAGTQGAVDTTFGTSGKVSLAGLNIALVGLTAQAVIPISTGQYYIAFKDTTPGASQVIRLTNSATLDTSYNATGFAEATSQSVYSMIMDAAGCLVLAGTTGGAGWVNRLATNGSLDLTFNGGGQVSITGSMSATNVVQQTLGRYVVAGQKTGGNGALFGLTDVGAVDSTFGVSGMYDTGIATTVYAVIADQYDRLIIAYRNSSTTAVDIRRLTSSAQLDTTFGAGGTITGAIADADDESQVLLTFDSSGNIVVAAHTSTPAIAVKAYTNTTGTVVETQLNISTIITNTPVMTDILATADGKILLAGYQSAANPMWVARVVNNSGAYALDTSTSIPAAGNITFGGGDGIMTFSFDADGTVDARNLNAIAIYGNGEIAMVGIESDTADTPDISPFLSMAYDNPYTTQEDEFEGSKPDGTNDVTLGASTTSTTNLGITFFGSSGANALSAQIARAVALQNNNTIVVAIDGGAVAGAPTPSQIFLTKFDIDGLVVSGFGTAGQATVLSAYQNQYVQDMVTFTTVAGVNKAILAGYVTNTTLGSTSSLLLQYNLDTAALDTTFGGFSGSPQGIAFGAGKQINTVAQQTSGRIIAAGISQDTIPQGLLLGYTSAGKLDDSFGNDGYLAISASTGLYTHAIDSLNRVIMAYNSGSTTVAVARYLADGSGLDTSFTAASLTTTLSGNSNIKIGVDSSNNVIVGACTNGTGNELTFNRYSVTDGAVLQTGIFAYAVLGGASSANYNFGQLIVDADNNVNVVLYDADAKKILVMRLIISGSDYILDTTFNTYNATTNPLGTAGYLLYRVTSNSTSQAAYDALIHPDGRIIIVGSEN